MRGMRVLVVVCALAVGAAAAVQPVPTASQYAWQREEIGA